MKKFTSLLALFLMFFGITAHAQLLKEISLNVSTKNGNPNVVVNGGNGITATLVSNHAAHKGKDKDFFMPSLNGSDMNNDKFITMTVELKGLPTDFKFNTVDVDLHALNGSFAYQSNSDGRGRQFNLDVLAGDNQNNLTLMGSLSDFDIAAGVGAPKNVHQMWRVQSTSSTTSSATTLALQLKFTKGTTNLGCFIGLSKIVLAEMTKEDLEAEAAKKEFDAAKALWKKLQGLVGFYSAADVKTASACATLAEAKAALEKCTKISISADEYYRLENVRREKAMSVNENGEQFADNIKNEDVSELWQFVAKGNSYVLVNANHTKYLAVPVSKPAVNGGNPVWLTPLAAEVDAPKLTLEPLTGADAQYGLSFNGADAKKKYIAGGGASGNYVITLGNASVDRDAAWYIRPVEQIDVSIFPEDKDQNKTKQEHWSTIYLPFNAKCGNGAAGVKYYGISAENTNTVVLSEMQGVTANQGVILNVNSKQTVYKFKIGKHANDVVAPNFKNLLVGTNVSISKPTDANVYVFGLNVKVPGLYGTAATTLKANKAYYVPATAAVNGFKFIFDEEVTGVDGVETATDSADGIYYDLSGRRVENPSHGIYIKSGKKVYVK